jgi:DNA-directed RNA polymerase subunit H
VITIAEKEFKIGDHFLVPKHTKLTDKEKEALLEDYKITAKELPKINIKDPAISHLDPSTDDVIRIDRASPTSKTTVFYRKVVK